MGVAVRTRQGAVSRPTSVCNASVRFKDFGGIGLLLGDKLLQPCDLADFLVDESFLLLVTVDCKSS